MRNIKNNEEGIAPLLIILALVGMAAGGGVVFAIAPQMMIIYFLFVGFFLIGIVALKSGPKTVKLLIPLFAAIVILVLIFSFIPLPWLSMAPPDFDTELKSRDIEGWRGEGNPNWEIPGSTNGEGIDSIRYISSYKPEGKSEKIVTQFRYCLIGLLYGVWDNYKYVYYFADGTSWTEDHEFENNRETSPSPGHCANAEANIWQLDWGYDGYIKVEFQVHFVGGLLKAPRWEVLAEDMAYVKEGIAKVEWNKDRYEVGETAKVKVTSGYCSSSKLENPESGGCTLRIYSGGQGELVYTENVPQNDITTISYTVTMADFDTGAGCENFLRAELTNDLISIVEDDATVIDFGELGPSKTIITTDKSNYNVGDVVVIEFESEPNDQTDLPIEKYHIKIYYTDGAQIILEETWTTSNTFISQTLMEEGTIAIDIFCQDEGCRPSEIATKLIKVYAEGDYRGELPLPWILILLLVAMLILGIAIFYFAKGVPIPLRIVIMIILLIIPVALYWMGVIY